MTPRPEIVDFAIALLLGALVGLERQRRRASDEDGGVAGIRTFMLLALAGAGSAWLATRFGSPSVLAAAILGVAALVAAGYLAHVRVHPASIGLTTEVAALLVFVVGALAVSGGLVLAVAIGIATSAVLAFKQPLHTVATRIGEEDLRAALKLLIATFVVLPLLPGEPLDPWGALVPSKIWLLVILISGLSFVGYVATRVLGAHRGVPLTGLFGGLVSSTAVTLAFAKRSREKEVESPSLAGPLATGILLAWGVMFVRILVEVAVVHAALLPRLALPMGAMAGTALAGAILSRGRDRGMESDALALKNPFRISSAIGFALLFAAVLLVVKVVQERAGGTGLYAVAALAGLTDVDAITLSMAGFAKGGGDATVAVRAIALAAVTNTLVKAGIVAVLGAAALRRRVLAATAAILAAAAATLLA